MTSATPNVSWQRPADFYDTQHSLGTTRVAVVRYGQPVQHIQQIGVTVVTSAALDLANLLNGVWDHKQPNTLRLRQLTRRACNTLSLYTREPTLPL